MIGRFTGAILGLLAFAVSVIAGIAVRNPFAVVLSRAIWALCIFFIAGLVLGAVAQFVIDDYAKRRMKERLPDLGAPPREDGPAGPEEPVVAQALSTDGGDAPTVDPTPLGRSEAEPLGT